MDKSIAMVKLATLKFKAAPTNISASIRGQRTTCNVRGVAHNEKPTENYHLTAVLLFFLGSFSSMFYGYGTVSLFTCFQQQQAAVFRKKQQPLSKQYTDKVSDWMVNTV